MLRFRGILLFTPAQCFCVGFCIFITTMTSSNPRAFPFLMASALLSLHCALEGLRAFNAKESSQLRVVCAVLGCFVMFFVLQMILINVMVSFYVWSGWLSPQIVMLLASFAVLLLYADEQVAPLTQWWKHHRHRL